MLFKPERGNVIYDVKERWIRLFGTITQNTAAEFAKFIVLAHAYSQDWREPFMVLIDSQGGDAVASQIIYFILANSPSPVFTFAEKKAYSGALTIFQAGQRRFIFKDTKLKFHWSCFCFFKDLDCDVEKADALSRKLHRLNDCLYKIYQKRTGLPMDEIKKFFREGRLFAARKAKKMNLADEIIAKPKKRKWKISETIKTTKPKSSAKEAGK